MSPIWGAVVGAGVGGGLVLVTSRIATLRRPRLEVRVLPYLRDVAPTPAGARPVPEASPTRAAAGVFGPVLRRAGDAVEKVLGGSASVRRRLRRGHLDMSVHDFRVEQVLWGLVAFVATAGVGALVAVRDPSRLLPMLLVSLVAFAFGVLLRENWLTAQVKARERRILEEFPTVAELLALAVAAGLSPVSALDRVVTRSGGELSRDLAEVLGRVRTGQPVGEAFDEMAATTGLPVVARFAQGVAVAMERGTPLADVLHAQAGDVREARRRELIESAARKEVLMMVPVVFLVLPVTVLFAFYPGVVGLSLTTP